jgi:hypothetical protein
MATSARSRGTLIHMIAKLVEREPEAAVATAVAIDAALDVARIAAPRVHHGLGDATWAVIAREKALGAAGAWAPRTSSSSRRPPATSNAALVAAGLTL